MEKVKRYSNWCEIDRLNGIDLIDGEKLKIKWEDGSTSIEVIKVEKYIDKILEQGGYSDIQYSIAYVPIKFKGTKSFIGLSGTKIECERINTVPVKKSEGIIRRGKKGAK